MFNVRRTQKLVKRGNSEVKAARLPISVYVGYGTTIPAKTRTFSRWSTASVQAVICSLAAAPTMVAPRINPFLSVTTLIWPRVSRSARARSLSW